MKTTLSFDARRIARRSQRTTTRSKRAFSLVEMLVALAIFLVLLAAIFVPIKLATDLSSVGTARASAQQGAVDGIRRMKTDIQRALVILPNANITGVTNGAPYSDNGNLPYLRDVSGYNPPATATSADGAQVTDACRAAAGGGAPSVIPVANTSRLDLILPNEDTGNVTATLKPSNVLVSYYCRRLDITKPFDPIDNPVVLFRAQMPFRVATLDATSGIYRTKAFPAWDNAAAFNADVSTSRFTYRTPAANCTPAVSRNLKWLTMNQYGEFDLAPICLPPTGTETTTQTDPNAPPTYGSHTLVLPRDTALLTPYAASDTAATPSKNMSLVPDTTFICSDSNGDGKIDQVKIQLSVGQYDASSVNRRDNNTGGTGPRTSLQPQVARTITETVPALNVQ